ncbi:DUF2846 domain-containing protein [Planctomycetota bacterium]
MHKIEKKIPSLTANQGRIFFYQAKNYSGSGVEHEVRLNGWFVGKSVPDGFFFVDRDAGKYVVHCSSDTLTFTLKAGETRYIEVVPTIYGDNPLGVNIVPMSNMQGEGAMRRLSYTGTALP